MPGRRDKQQNFTALSQEKISRGPFLCKCVWGCPHIPNRSACDHIPLLTCRKLPHGHWDSVSPTSYCICLLSLTSGLMAGLLTASLGLGKEHWAQRRQRTYLHSTSRPVVECGAGYRPPTTKLWGDQCALVARCFAHFLACLCC